MIVVIFHIIDFKQIFQSGVNFGNFQCLLPIYGYTGVYLFFVISGFCIHLRRVKAKGKGIEDPQIDVIAFWKRRLIRLYAAYLAAIVIYLAWEYLAGLLMLDLHFVWDLAAYLLMIHNLDNHVVFR